MNSEKVKEIKNALEEYIRQYSNFKGAELCEEALTLISDLESENERLKHLREVVAPIYVMPNVETPAMMLKLGEKNIVQQFAERLKEKCEYNRKQYCCEATVSFNDIDETLKEFLL